MNKDDFLESAYSELGDAAADLRFAGFNELSKIVKGLESEIRELIDGGRD